MFGQNPIRKQELKQDSKLWVQEVFATIQGEGPFSGIPSVFVRLAGCNLKCHFCDTDFESSQWRPALEELMSAIYQQHAKISRSKLVVITGGEPFRQNITPLVERLLREDFAVQIETAGTLGIDNFPYEHPNVSIVCSPKTGKLHASMVHATAWKYVLSHPFCQETGLPLASTQIKGQSTRIASPLNDADVFVMPCDQQDEALNRTNHQLAVEVAMKFGYRLTLQIHKIVNIP